MDNSDNTVKGRLKAYLSANSITMAEFGRRIGVSSAYITSMRKSIQPDKVERIKEEFPDLDIDWLLTGVKDDNSPPIKTNDTILIPVASPDSIGGTRFNEEVNTEEYINMHLELGRKIGKPVVVEEFGMPRDDMDFHKGSPVSCRDMYYTFVFDLIVKARQSNDVFAGCNFWSWGGYAKTNVEDHEYWAKGDDYTGDPAQEQQGLNSIFVEDESTLNIIRETNNKLGNL